LYVRWHEGAEIIAYRTSPLGQLSFGRARPFIVVPGLDLNDVTGTKQPLPRGSVIAIADGGGMAWWDGWGSPPRGGKMRSAGSCQIAAHAVPACDEAALALAFDEGSGHVTSDGSGHASRAVLGGT